MTTTPSPAPTPALDRLFNTLRRSPVTRSNNRAIAGVCAGIAERLGVPTGLVRVGTVLAAIFGPAFALYLLAWLVLPDADGRIRLERALRQGDLPSIALLVVSTLAVLPGLGFHHHMAWSPILLVAALVFLYRRGSSGRRGSTCSGERSPAAGGGPAGPQDAPLR